MSSLKDILERLAPNHRDALLWFQQHHGKEVAWPKAMPNGTFLVNKAKGIHKPAGLPYAISVRESLGGRYLDHEPVVRPDGSWTYRYYQEQADPAKRDSQFTNLALLACKRDGVPIGVMRQVKTKPNPRYHVLGLALVREWEGGYFHLEGFGPAGEIGSFPPKTMSSDTDGAMDDIFNPDSVEDARRWINASIVRRQGQGAFRAAVLSAYRGRCAMSAFNVPEALEAAHIFRYFGASTNTVTNGLLLRSDLHSLYDLGLLAVDPASMTVLLAPKLKTSDYGALAGSAIQLPTLEAERPSRAALQMHASWAVSTWHK
ncbi:HNH endonuclease [Cupriavidus pauculus]|uniref:HNH endonuclease n=1 Tax=Cupriavidus pauculus TaxID=82633 RepID=A0A2N5C8K7_9BURK|nr:HNH endonuclease [Cupriavidus pauculus]PLP98547.1 HNH endonuclease [Cupriavidus pauculus]